MGSPYGNQKTNSFILSPSLRLARDGAGGGVGRLGPLSARQAVAERARLSAQPEPAGISGAAECGAVRTLGARDKSLFAPGECQRAANGLDRDAMRIVADGG